MLYTVSPRHSDTFFDTHCMDYRGVGCEDEGIALTYHLHTSLAIRSADRERFSVQESTFC